MNSLYQQAYTKILYMKKSVSVIIPAYNEVRTVGSLVQLCLCWPKATEVIVVNDGSGDGTDAILKRFGKKISYIRFPHNRGQGAALAAGIRKARADIILTIDADVSSVTHRDLDDMIAPLEKETADMAIAILNYWKTGNFEPFNDISGTRAMLRKYLLPHIEKIEKSKYGVTVSINSIHKHLRVVSVRTPYVYVLGKFEKQSVPEAMQAYVKEASELILQALKDQAGGKLTPFTKKVFRSVSMYFKKTLDFFQ